MFNNYVKSNDILNDFYVTVCDAEAEFQTIRLNDFNKDVITFGKGDDNDIVLISNLQGCFRFMDGHWVIEDSSVYGENPSNTMMCNHTAMNFKILNSGDIFCIDVDSDRVLFLFSLHASNQKWNRFRLQRKSEFKIGHGSDCDIVFPRTKKSDVCLKIIKERDGYYLVSHESIKKIMVNNKCCEGIHLLKDKDIINIMNLTLVFTSKDIFYCYYSKGFSIQVENVVIDRGKRKKSFITCNNMSFNIKSGELVAILGGSGDGKTTIVDCMSGYLPPKKGHVYVNGVDLYENFELFKGSIGYVPQFNVLHEDLNLYEMLVYTVKLRLSKDISKHEYEWIIGKVIQMVGLTEKKYSKIKTLSGGQKKRAHIAAELLSDPNVLFLDEPSSGLDPGIENEIMNLLRKIANEGKTVVFITHSLRQLKLCDKIMFVGRNGNLCFFGTYKEALNFFEVDDIAKIYNMIAKDSEKWSKKYKETQILIKKKEDCNCAPFCKVRRRWQLPVLCARYVNILLNDRQRLFLLMIQAPILATLIALISNSTQFVQYEATKGLLFSLACSVVWIGLLNSIQEICKECNSMHREYMMGLSISSYLCSKILVLIVFCLLQGFIILGMFAIFVGLPEQSLLFNPFIDLAITTSLLMIASVTIGLFVSTLFKSADRALAVAPILLMPQILLSGMIFSLEGITETISNLVICRWGMEGYGTIANLNALDFKWQLETGVIIPHEFEDCFDFQVSHLISTWVIILIFIACFIILSRISLLKVKKQ